MRKLISIGIVLALLVTFLMPVTIGADVEPPVAANITPPMTDSIGGALLWTLLGTSYIMGGAVGDVTEHMAGTLGGYVDELATPTFGVIGAITKGIGGLLGGLGGLLGMEDIFDPLSQMLTDMANEITKIITP